MCIYEERKNLTNQNIEEREHEIESERNAIFNQLMCIPHNMVLFGIEEKEAKAFASKWVKLFNLTARQKDIDKNIESANTAPEKNRPSQTVKDTLSMRSEQPITVRSALRSNNEVS
jgi:hypothetical protein